ncbi:MAG TPA: hypothetical protein VHO28_07610 [Ignavibacteriales bacterium]|nr:hypothetical protein [Ignavibacteriales bacterium]
MKKSLLFFLIFAAALQAQPSKGRSPIEIEKMNIARKNIFWSVTLSLWNIDPGIPVTDISPLSVDAESMKKFESILRETSISRTSWFKFFFNYEVKNVVFAANFKMGGKIA